MRDLGQLNDNGRTVTIVAPTVIEVKKDMFPCGKVYVDVLPEAGRTADHGRGVPARPGPGRGSDRAQGRQAGAKDLVYLGGFSHGLNVTKGLWALAATTTRGSRPDD